MAQYDGWMAKDNDGNLWLGTFSVNKKNAKKLLFALVDGDWDGRLEFKIVKVKLVEVK